MAEPNCAAIVLAAGSSSRLGQPKQLVQIDHESLLRRTVRMAWAAGFGPVVVVLGFEVERMQRELDGLGVIPEVNQEWQSGMGSSLRCGITALTTLDPAPRNVLLLVCDQVRLSVEFLQQLLSAHSSGVGGITAARYNGHLGVPAIFSESFFPEMLAVKGDRGARGILEAHAGQVTAVDFPGGELDLDTPEQLGAIE
jgi:molybdenum cofactor cytidylyltransferase